HAVRARRLQVQGQRSLVPVQVLEVAPVPGLPRHARRGRVGRVGRWLHADDVGAPVGELADTGGARARDRQVDDADIAKGKINGHASSPPRTDPARPHAFYHRGPPGRSAAVAPAVTLRTFTAAIRPPQPGITWSSGSRGVTHGKMTNHSRATAAA